MKRILIACYGITFSVLLINRVLLVFDYTPDLGGIEPVFTYYTLCVTQNIPLYSSWNEIPFSNNQYSFLYFELLGNILPSGVDVIVLNRLARFFNLLLNLGTAFLAMRIFSKLFNRGVFLQFIVFCSTFFAFQNLHFSTRPDSLKSFLIFGLLLAFVHLIKGPTKILAGICFAVWGTLAILTKQDAVIVLTLLCCFGFAYFKRKVWLRITAATGILIGLSLMIAQYYYGDYFLSNLAMPGNFNFSLSYFYLAIFKPYWHWFILIAASTTIALLSKNENRKKLALLLFTWMTGTFFISLKWGAAPNYYQELVVLALILLIESFSENQAFSKNASLLILPFILLSIDVQRGNIKIFNKELHLLNKQLVEDYYKVDDSINKRTHSSSFYLLTYEKSICNLFPNACLFPSYESTQPEDLVKSTTYYFPGSESKKIFPDLPKVAGLDKRLALKKGLNSRDLILVKAKHIPLDEIFSIRLDDCVLTDSTDFFYIYTMSGLSKSYEEE